MMRRILILLILVPLSSCDDGRDELRMPRGMLPAAAELAPGPEDERLDRQLRVLEAELVAAQAGEPERLLTAEAITDRLVHAERGLDWLASNYDVEARLRQLQAMADRVVARLQRGSPLDRVSGDVDAILVAVRDLQSQLERPGGGAPPPTLDSLLAQDPLRDAQARALRDAQAGSPSAETVDPRPETETSTVPAPSGPLGVPVQPDTTPPD